MPMFLYLGEFGLCCPKLLPNLLSGGVSNSLKGNVCIEGTEVFHSVKGCCASHTLVDCREDRSHIGTKKLDLKSNCTTSTPYIVHRSQPLLVLRVSVFSQRLILLLCVLGISHRSCHHWYVIIHHGSISGSM